MAQLRAGAGASDSLFQHERPNNPDMSRFDISRFTNFTCDAGMIVPFDSFPTLPGDEIDIDFEQVLNTLPMVQPTLTQYKVVTHWYYMRCRDMWKGWQTFITKGRSGNVVKHIPRINLEYGYNGNSDFNYDIVEGKYIEGTSARYVTGKVLPIGYHSLSSFLGVPPILNGEGHLVDSSFVINKTFLPYTLLPKSIHGASASVLTEISDALHTDFNLFKYPNALPFMMYQSIVKNNYVNQNMLQNNTDLFPMQGDNDWLLPYDATILNTVGSKELNSNADVLADITQVEETFGGVFHDSPQRVRLDSLRYAMFDDDYFTTALPWLQRGDAHTLETDVSSLVTSGAFENLVAEISNTVDASSVVDSPISEVQSPVLSINSAGNLINAGQFDPNNEWHSYSSNVKSAFEKLKVTSALNQLSGRFISTNVDLRLGITANNLRNLLAFSVWQERNARVNGSYNSMIYQHWRVDAHDNVHKPVYIGGTADYVAFATILQNSQSSSDSPLGATAGRGASSGQARVGSFRADDYGFVMGIMIIKPVTTYQQGVEHHLSCEDVFEDMVQPEFQGLEPQPILNKEVYVSSGDIDDDLFGYQERYTYLKVRNNVNRGMFQCAPYKDSLFGPMTQARWFTSLPELSYQFLVMSPDNMRKDWLAYPSEPTFYIQTASKVFVNRKLGYISQPETFGF